MFKELFTEKATQNSYSTKYLASKGYIPLSPPMMERLGLSTKNFTAYHATTISHLKELSKLGNSKKAISAFTKGLHSIIRNIVVKPDVVARVTGTKLLGASQDFYTYIDKQGRRWFNIRGKKEQFMFDALISKPLKTLVQSNYENWEEEYDKLMNNQKLIMEFVGYNNKISKKSQSVFVKDYIDNAERLLSNSMYLKIVQEYLKNSSKYSHDEVIMNKFKVEEVYSIEAGKYTFDKSMAEFDITKLGYSYGGHIEKMEFSKFPQNSPLTPF